MTVSDPPLIAVELWGLCFNAVKHQVPTGDLESRPSIVILQNFTFEKQNGFFRCTGNFDLKKTSQNFLEQKNTNEIGDFFP